MSGLSVLMAFLMQFYPSPGPGRSGSAGGGGGGGGVTATDNFNRADSSSLGSNWQTFSAETSPTIVGNQLAGSGRAGWIGSAIGPDQYSQATVVNWAGFNLLMARQSNGQFYGCGVSDDAATMLYYHRSTISGDHTIMTRLIASTIGRTVQAGDVIRIEVRGQAVPGTSVPEITCLINGVSLDTAQDFSTGPLASGTPGIAALDEAVRFDNWSGGDLP